MKLPTNVENALNAQIRNELQSHYNYLGISAHFETTPYAGFAKWFRMQSTEEYGHAMKLFDYLQSRNAAVELHDLQAPAAKFNGAPVDVFEVALKQEESVTQQINDIYELAQKEKDYTTIHFLTWFLQEQVEEEKTFSDMIDRLRLVADNAAGLLRVDDEAGRRAAAGAA